MLGSMGMAHPAVDGFLIDDWYTILLATVKAVYASAPSHQ
jgi:hypothetical protein|eukprot:COSAG01_NODE_528_length_15893_cov_49.094846_2_plen_40_part_00